MISLDNAYFTYSAFVFDVDGTLTPSRTKIDKEFEKYFIKFCNRFNVVLITGSDYAKTREQLGDDILFSVNKTYNCAGNSKWVKGKEVRTEQFMYPPELITFLKDHLSKSEFLQKSGAHIEHRTGMINFSIVGRNASLQERFNYVQWDRQKSERSKIAEELNKLFRFDNITASVAGETGIDIMNIGKDKSQIAGKFDHPIIFFGDQMQEGGNDHTLARALEMVGSKTIQVKDWKDTYKCLQNYLNAL